MDEPFPDLGSLSDDELKRRIEKLVEEEEAISERRRIVHGHIDLYRGELVHRLRKRREQGGGGWPPSDSPPELGQ
jgi:hypothetical protein